MTAKYKHLPSSPKTHSELVKHVNREFNRLEKALNDPSINNVELSNDVKKIIDEEVNKEINTSNTNFITTINNNYY